MELGPSNITVLDGKDATMNCRAAGAPTPNITWVYNGKFDKFWGSMSLFLFVMSCVFLLLL